MVRYPFLATIKGEPVLDENGDPISEGVDIPFFADYQPTIGGEKVNYAGSFVEVKYKLFVSPTSTLDFKIGSEVICNNSEGVIVSNFPTSLNIELWVK